MKVKEFIEFLQKCPQDYQVAYRLYSEQCLLKEEDITVSWGMCAASGRMDTRC